MAQKKNNIETAVQKKKALKQGLAHIRNSVS